MDVDKRLVAVDDSLYRLAVRAVIIRDNKLLFVRDEPKEDWGFPGGGIDYGETLEQALERELLEELELQPKDTVITREPLFISAGPIKNGVPRANVFYLVETTKENIENSQGVAEVKWFPIKELTAQAFNPSNGDLTKVLDKIQGLLS